MSANSSRLEIGQLVILYASNEPTTLTRVRAELQGVFEDGGTVETVLGGEEALERFDDLESEGYCMAIAIAAAHLPDMGGDDLLERIHQRSPQTRTILLCGPEDLDRVGNALRNAHLQSCLVEPWEPVALQALVNDALAEYHHDRADREENVQIRHARRELEDLARRQSTVIAERTAELEAARTTIANLQAEVERLAVTDNLTQVANRRYFIQCLDREWQRLARDGQPLALIFCDVDAFTSYNDLYGYPQGDRCLQAIARTLASVTQRAGDLVARYSDRAFAVLLPDTERPGAEQVAERIRRAVRDLDIAYPESEIADRLTVSVGVVCRTPQPGQVSQTAIAAVERALADAKLAGRDRIAVAAPSPTVEPA